MRLTSFLFILLAACQSAPPLLPTVSAPLPDRGEDTIPANEGDGSAPPPAPEIITPALTIDRLPTDYLHGGEVRAASDIDLIVIHTIGGAECREGQILFTRADGSAVFWRDWFARQTDKSIHYIIDREGKIAQQRPDLRTAGHVSAKDVLPGINRRSIGIELVNRGNGIEPFAQAQIDSLKNLLSILSSTYHLPSGALRTHAELDPRMQPDCGGVPLRRNVDPGPLFPLEDVRAAMQPG
jgi:hypothetical protein